MKSLTTLYTESAMSQLDQKIQEGIQDEIEGAQYWKELQEILKTKNPVLQQKIQEFAQQERSHLHFLQQLSQKIK